MLQMFGTLVAYVVICVQFAATGNECQANETGLDLNLTNLNFSIF